MKLEIHCEKKIGIFTNIYKLKATFLNKRVKGEIEKEI